MVTSSHQAPDYSIRNVSLLSPFAWLLSAWKDLLHHSAASLTYGLIVSLLAMLALAYERHPFYIATVISGFFLIGPILAAGLCELSRCSDKQQAVNFDESLKVLRQNHDSLIGIANRLLILSVTWFAFSFLLMQTFLSSVAPDISQTVWGDVLRLLTDAQIICYLLSGGTLAIIVFALSVVSIPMIIDRNVDAHTAIKTSLKVCTQDLPVMLVWGALLVVMVGIGFATYLVGMIVIFPLLGHATWYAYRDLVE